MKKIFIFLVIFFSTWQTILAQNPVFVTGGVSLFGGQDKNSEAATVLPSVTIMPGIKFIDKKDFCFLVAAPISVGASDDEGDFYLGVDLPLTLNINFGYGFTSDSKSKAGFFAGGGMAYHNSYNESYDWDGMITSNHLRFAGYLIHTGVTVRFGKNDPEGILIRLSWLSQYPEHKKNVIGIGLIAVLK
jgi:hypothetical protein